MDSNFIASIFPTVVPALLGVLLIKRDQVMARAGYIQRVIAFVVAGLVGGFLIFALGAQMAGILILIFVLVLNFLLARWVSLRIQDCGWNRNLRFIFVVPYVSLIMLIVMMFPASKPRTAPDPAVFD